MHVLIVEDDASVAELCRRILEAEGYSCALARTVKAARESIADRTVDLLLADVILPGGASGRDLAGEMHSAEIPVLYMSGDYQALRELTTAGLAYLQKPFRLGELLSRVRDALPRGGVTADA
jgi:DNA-binding response OmpR family regulator